MIYDRQNFSYVAKSKGYLLLFILYICKPEHEVLPIFPSIYFMVLFFTQNSKSIWNLYWHVAARWNLTWLFSEY